MSGLANTAVAKIQGVLVSATQETTIALANLNFDFSLVKVEAPVEYNKLGHALSRKHRAAAEGGQSHMTARKLGSLFESTLPITPKLIKTYGLRSSEISASTLVIPGKDDRCGPFIDFMGIDGTSIWAAATSSRSAIAAHLLACMLARMWSPAEATSIWEDLIFERKKDLATATEAETDPLQSAAAAQLVIPREQLAEWDASARAWLRVADNVEPIRVKQKQIMLIVGNVNIPVSKKPRVYASVIKAWGTALSTMDSIIGGSPFRIQDGAVLLALSAWHLYPDILILDKVSKDIRQHDHLIDSGGIVTIGLRDTTTADSPGVCWSLSLAHFRYYGDPVSSKRLLSSDSSRLTVDQFLLVALGCCFGSWGVEAEDYHKGARLLVLVGQCLDQVLKDVNLNFGQTMISYAWPKILGRSAALYLKATKNEQATANRLVGLGTRRQKMIVRQRSDVFGLDGPQLVFSMKRDEDKVSYLRHIASKTNFRPEDLLICSLSSSNGDSGNRVSQYIMTAVSSGNSLVSSYHHLRWEITPMKEDRTISHKDEQWDQLQRLFLKDGELLLKLDADCIDISYSSRNFSIVWHKPPDYYNRSTNTVGGSYSCLQPNTSGFEFFAGDPKGVALLARAHTLNVEKDIVVPRANLEEVIKFFANDSICSFELFNHFNCLEYRAYGRFSEIHHKHTLHDGEYVKKVLSLCGRWLPLL